MAGILAHVLELFKFIFIDMDGGDNVTTGLEYSTGAMQTLAAGIIGNELLILPIVIMLVGLVVGIFARVVNSVRG